MGTRPGHISDTLELKWKAAGSDLKFRKLAVRVHNVFLAGFVPLSCGVKEYFIVLTARSLSNRPISIIATDLTILKFLRGAT